MIITFFILFYFIYRIKISNQIMIKLKKTNIQLDIENPEIGWIIIGSDEDGNLVKKDENGVYEKIIKDESYGIYIKLESDYLTIGNRITNSSEGLYSYSQGEYNEASNLISTSRGQYLKSTNVLSYASGKGYGNTINGSYYLYSNGINSFVHSYSTSANDYGSYANYSVILGGTNQLIQVNANSSVIIGGSNNTILENISGTTIIGGNGIIANVTNTLYTPNIIVTGLTATVVNSQYFNGYNVNVQLINCNTIDCNSITLSEIDSTTQITSPSYHITGSITQDFIMSDGTVNTDRYVSVSGGTMYGTLITLNSIVSKSSINFSNVVIGVNNFNNSSGTTLPNVNSNVILGYGNVQNIIVSNNNVVIGYNNAVTDSLLSGVTNMSNNIIIGNNNKIKNNVDTEEIIIGNGVTGNGINTITLGSPSNTNGTYLNGTVYTPTGNVSVSDERLKTEIRKFTTWELKASKELLQEIGLFKFLESIKDKGDAAREHVGMTVQRAIQIMKNNGLDPFNYAFICRDLNTDIPLDPMYKDDPYKYSFRYLELIIFITTGLGEEINNIYSRLDILESNK